MGKAMIAIGCLGIVVSVAGVIIGRQLVFQVQDSVDDSLVLTGLDDYEGPPEGHRGSVRLHDGYRWLGSCQEFARVLPSAHAAPPLVLQGFAPGDRLRQALTTGTRRALDLQEAGCFSIVFEAVPAEVTDLVMPLLECLVIGIGAGRGTDGQVLVLHDLLAMHEGHVARFVRQFADVRGEMRRGLTAYAEAVRSGGFPTAEHSYTIPREEMDLLRSRWAARQSSPLDASPG